MTHFFIISSASPSRKCLANVIKTPEVLITVDLWIRLCYSRKLLSQRVWQNQLRGAIRLQNNAIKRGSLLFLVRDAHYADFATSRRTRKLLIMHNPGQLCIE